MVHYKARLVAKGFKMKFDFDVFETFNRGKHEHSQDNAGYGGGDKILYITTGCRHGVLEQQSQDEVYMEAPSGIANNEKMVFKLYKVIYVFTGHVEEGDSTVIKGFCHYMLPLHYLFCFPIDHAHSS